MHKVEAVKKICNGHKIRKATWSPECFIYMDVYGTFLDENNELYDLNSLWDGVAYEIYEDPMFTKNPQ